VKAKTSVIGGRQLTNGMNWAGSGFDSGVGSGVGSWLGAGSGFGVSSPLGAGGGSGTASSKLAVKSFEIERGCGSGSGFDSGVGAGVGVGSVSDTGVGAGSEVSGSMGQSGSGETGEDTVISFPLSVFSSVITGPWVSYSI